MKTNFDSAPKSSLTPYPPKGGLPNSMIFRCSPLGLGVKQMKIIEFPTFRSGLKIQILHYQTFLFGLTDIPK